MRRTGGRAGGRANSSIRTRCISRNRSVESWASCSSLSHSCRAANLREAQAEQSMAGPGELTCPWFPAHACIPSLPDSAMHCKYQGDELECKWMDSCEKIRPSTHPIRRPEVRAVLHLHDCMHASNICTTQCNATRPWLGWAASRANECKMPLVRAVPKCPDARLE